MCWNGSFKKLRVAISLFFSYNLVPAAQPSIHHMTESQTLCRTSYQSTKDVIVAFSLLHFLQRMTSVFFTSFLVTVPVRSLSSFLFLYCWVEWGTSWPNVCVRADGDIAKGNGRLKNITCEVPGTVEDGAEAAQMVKWKGERRLVLVQWQEVLDVMLEPGRWPGVATSS